MRGERKTAASAESGVRATEARQATGKLAEATQAIREAEAWLPVAFELVEEAEQAAIAAGLVVKVAMSPEVGAGYRAWLEARAYGQRDEHRVIEPDFIPAFLRSPDERDLTAA